MPALVIDAAAWFTDELLREHVGVRHWRRLPARLAVGVRAVRAELERCAVGATFLVPAQLAEREPALCLQLCGAGHELALSVATAVPLDEVPEGDRAALLEQWRAERERLAAAIGLEVRGFAAAWPVGDGAAWWREGLRAIGFAWDATPRTSDAALSVIGLEAGGCVATRFHAWRLDREQPRLGGLPAAARERHEAAVRSGPEELAGLVSRAKGTISGALGLPPAAPFVAPPPRVAPPSRVPGSDTERLAVVVPLKDEGEGVAALFAELDALARDLADVARCEFVVVDDGSRDDTWPQLQQLAASRPGVRLVQHPHNRGVAAAIATGIAHTDAERVASIDGDLSYDPRELRPMLALLDAQHAAVVTASPYHPDGGVLHVPGWRLFLSRGLSFGYRLLLRRPIRTWTACFRVYRRAAVADLPLQHEGFLGTAELLVRVLRRGGVVVEHPCVLEARLLGFSKMRVARTVRGHLGLLWRVAFGLGR